MKMIACPVSVIVVFDEKGEMQPIKIKYNNMVIKIDKVIFKEFGKRGGIKTWIYRCLSLNNNLAKEFEIKYFIDDCRWMLWRG